MTRVECEGNNEAGGIMDMHDFDLAIIGGGPGGYVAAIRGAIGKRLMYRDPLGGC